MGVDEIKNLKEGLYFERKSAKLAPKDIVRHVLAMANANGGIIAIGIEDNGNFTGFGYSGANNEELFKKAILENCHQMPNIYSEKLQYGNDDGEYIFLIHITVSVNRVLANREGKVYLRVGDVSKELSHEQILQLEYDKGQRRYESEKIAGSSIGDIDTALLNVYRTEMHAEGKSDYDLLEKRGLIAGEELTVAGVLLFAKNPTKYLPNARVRFIRYEGTEMKYGSAINILKEVTFDEPLPILLKKLITLVRSQLREFQSLSKETGRFEIIPEYPEAAWIEGIVNAVTHRDYSISGNRIEIKMFDDRLEIVSPGKLPNIVTLENMKYTQYSRNPQLARVLAELHWVKELNEGVNRIYEEMQKFFLDAPQYSEPNGNSVKLVFWNNIIMRHMRRQDKLIANIGSDIWSDLDEIYKNILSFMTMRNTVSKQDLMKFMKLSGPTIVNRLNYLINKGLIKANGSKTSPSRTYEFIWNDRE